MANTIRIKKRASSGSTGAPSTLAPSELAFNENTSDLKLYYGYGDNGSGEASSIIAVGGSGAFWNKTDTRTANTILSGPTTGSAAAPTFRSLVVADIPTLTASKVSDFDTQVRTSRLDQMAAATSVISGVTPVSDANFATKGYVDSTSEGLDVKQSVKVSTTANITLANTQTVDGVSLAANDRVLVKDQSTSSQNGLYKVVDGGSWTRTDDLATGADAAGAFTFVEQGSTNADIGFVCTSNTGSAVVGTNDLAFSTFSSSGNVTAGNGLDKSGNQISLDLKANGGCVIESTELAVDLSASSITGTLAVGDGGTGATSASAARTALGLAIGTNVQAYDSDLDALSSCQSGAASALALLTSTEVGILDGATVTTTELNLLDGVTATTTELNYVDGVTSAIQTQLDAKQASDADLTALSSCQTGGAAALAALTSTEIEILDGATVTTTELNTCCDGGTSATSTTLATADRMVINDAGTMVQVALSDLVTFLENGSVSGFELDGGTF
tara:strand:+ start:14113 stop:15621 length:1509 start_codon:yes stop_codon:yes gene_type:complete